jgi:hypothetical protein
MLNCLAFSIQPNQLELFGFRSAYTRRFWLDFGAAMGPLIAAKSSKKEAITNRQLASKKRTCRQCGGSGVTYSRGAPHLARLLWLLRALTWLGLVL